MNTRNWIPGSVGLAAAVLALLSITACDPYIQANTAAPVVIGVTMNDVAQNGIPADSTGCIAPYPEPDHVWAEQTYPGTCTTGSGAMVCPVLCYPPRMGPAFAPYYFGNLGGTYQTNILGRPYTFELPLLYVLPRVPPIYVSADGVEYDFFQIRVMFNKLMNPQSIQPDPARCVPPPTLRVFEGAVDVTSQFKVCYNPNSDTDYWGASITATRFDLADPLEPAIALNPNSTYRIVGVVQDQQGNSLDVAVTVLTVADVVDSPTSLSYATAVATYAVGTAITPNAPTVDGGAVSAFTVSPALPAGLVISKSTGVISGTPTAATATATYTVTAENGAGSVTTDIVITVN